MSGHSKWSTIKRKKGANDAARAKVFTKIGRELAVAVKQGGPDPSVNTKLKDIIAKAKQNNVPGDNIDRMLKKAAGETDTANYEEIIYEGYGPSGVAVVVEALTDNRNRTAGEVRHYFDKAGGNMGTQGSVTFMFNRQGVIVIEREDVDEDQLMEDALEAVKEGTMQGTVYNDNVDQAGEIARLAVDLFKGNDISKHKLKDGRYYMSLYQKVETGNVDEFLEK